jgi:hypothetical protein
MKLYNILNDNLSKINDWLRFSEAKAATLIAGNGVLIFGILRLIKDGHYNQLLVVYVGLVIFQLFISLVLCLVSFIPTLELKWFTGNSCSVNGTNNLVYFNDICQLSPIEYLESINKANGLIFNDFSAYEKMLSNQIVTNSKIVTRKMKIFKLAIWFTLSAMVTPLGALVLNELK